MIQDVHFKDMISNILLLHVASRTVLGKGKKNFQFYEV
jgi:hypothetical protein